MKSKKRSSKIFEGASISDTIEILNNDPSNCEHEFEYDSHRFTTNKIEWGKKCKKCDLQLWESTND